MRSAFVARLPLLIFLLAILGAAACTPGNNGAQGIAFIRNNRLYTIQPNGSTLFQVTGPTVMGFAWSPDHHQLVVRFSGYIPLPDFSNGITQSRPTFPSVLGVVSVDGGNIMAITPGGNLTDRSDAWWNANGNRLLYAEGQSWILSQADQPSGIARKLIATEGSAPTSSADGSQVALIANNGNLMIGTAGQSLHILQTHVSQTLANNMPAMPLWQPYHKIIVYPVAEAGGALTIMATDLQGKSTAWHTGSNIDAYAWSPDGTNLLVHDANKWSFISANPGHAITDIPLTSNNAVPYWSPDSSKIVFWSNDIADNSTKLYMEDIKSNTVKQLGTLPLASAAGTVPLRHPITGSPWSSDSKHFVFASHGGIWSKGQALATKPLIGTGLYSVDITNIDHNPSLIDWGEHLAVSWSTPDPNTQIELP